MAQIEESSAIAEGVELYQKAERLRPTSLTERQRATRELYDRLSSERDRWLARNRFFYDNDRRYMQFLVPSGQRVLELGCGEGQLLRSLQPSHGVGVDLSQEMIDRARKHAPEFEFHIGNAEDPELLDSIVGPFDYIILSDMVGETLYPKDQAGGRLLLASVGTRRAFERAHRRKDAFNESELAFHR